MKTVSIKNKFNPKRIFGLLILIVLLASCSNDFLDMKYPSDFIAGDTLIVVSNTENFGQEINLRNTTTASWKLYQFPRWLEISPKEGTAAQGSDVEFQFSVLENEMYFDFGVYTAPLVFEVEGAGLVQHTVLLWNIGNPEISNTPSEIEVDYTLQGMYQIVNSGNGILLWEVVNKPDWLTLETTEGILNAHEYGIWHFTIHPDGLEPGDYSGKVEILNNASNASHFIEFKFTIEELGYYGGYLTGEFVDAVYIKNLDQVAVLTKNPNNLLFFHSASPDIDTLKLNRVPKCFSLSEDGMTLAVGFSNTEISTYSTASQSLLGTYNAGNVPAHMVFSGENRLFYLEQSEYGYFLTGLDLTTGVRYKSKDSEGGLSSLKKVPGKDLLLATRPGWSPDGLFLYDISHDLVTDSLNEYWMSLNGFWLSEEGERIFTGTRKIYKVPEYVPGQLWSMEAPPVLGEFDVSNNMRINSIAHHSETGKIFIACDEGWYRNTSFIKILNANTLLEQQTLVLNPNPPYGYPAGNTWWSRVLNIFPGASGNEIWVIQEQPAADYNAPNTFSIERLEF